MASIYAHYTLVKNISGERKPFGFLPPHGVTLDAGQEYSFRGDLLTYLQEKRPVSAQGLQAAMAAGDLEVRKLPSPILDQGEGYTGEEQGKELMLTDVGMADIPAGVVGLWWPGQDVRLGLINPGNDTCDSLRNYVAGQSPATPGSFTYQSASAQSLPFPFISPDVEADVFGDEAAIVIQDFNSDPVGIHGLRLFPTYDESLIDGTELLGISFLCYNSVATSVDTASIPVSYFLSVNGNMGVRLLFQRTGAGYSVLSYASLAAFNPTTLAFVVPTTPGGSGLSLPLSAVDGTSGPFLITCVYNGSTGLLRVNGGQQEVTYSGFSGWTGATGVQAANAAISAVTRITLPDSRILPTVKLGPVAVFKATTDENELTEIEELVHHLAGDVTLYDVS